MQVSSGVECLGLGGSTWTSSSYTSKQQQEEEEKLPEQWSVCCKKTETETLRAGERRALFD